MRHVGRRRVVRLLALAAVLLQLVVLLASPVLIPVAVGAIFGGVTGLRLVSRDADAAVLRLGVGVVVSLLSTGIGVLSAALGLALPAAASSVCFVLAWWRMRQLAEDQRTAWGISYRDRIAQRPDEQLRLLSPPSSVPDDDPPAQESDDDAWWERLD